MLAWLKILMRCFVHTQRSHTLIHIPKLILGVYELTEKL